MHLNKRLTPLIGFVGMPYKQTCHNNWPPCLHREARRRVLLRRCAAHVIAVGTRSHADRDLPTTVNLALLSDVRPTQPSCAITRVHAGWSRRVCCAAPRDARRPSFTRQCCLARVPLPYALRRTTLRHEASTASLGGFGGSDWVVRRPPITSPISSRSSSWVTCFFRMRDRVMQVVHVSHPTQSRTLDVRLTGWVGENSVLATNPVSDVRHWPIYYL